MAERASGDKQLASRMLAGDDEAFERFFEWHFPRLYRFALKRLSFRHDDAEEVAQATLCKAIDKLESYRGEAPLFTWLCTFCRHEIGARYRQLNREPIEANLLDDLPEVQGILDSLVSSDDPQDELRKKEVERLVHVTLDRLPYRYGLVLESKYIKGLSMKEIAGQLDTTSKAVESLLTRARQAFKDAFSGVVGGLGEARAGGGRS
jgi:RNA polymerase sigma-70 factor (ECF subfamily)